RQITYGSGSKDSPQWKPDGKLIAFLTGGAIKVVEPNGSNLRQVYPPPHKGSVEQGDETSHNGQPDQETEEGKKAPINRYLWSPNGISIAAVQVNEGDYAYAIG